MIQPLEILPGVRLRCVQTDRFKSSCLSINLLRPLQKAEAAKNALLSNVLMQGTQLHPDMQSLSLAMDELYGTSMGPMCRKNGEIQTVGFYMSCLDDRYALPGDRVLERAIGLLTELMLNPLLIDGCFCPEYVTIEQENLINTIESAINDKRTYANSRMLKAMCRDDVFGVERLGTVADVEAITPQSLYAHYQSILATSQVEIFYAGSQSQQTIAELLTSALSTLPRGALTPLSYSAMPSHEGVQELEETMELTQSKLSMGFTTGITSRDPEYAALMVFNALYGGDMTSKLFMNVREKLSLCYYAGSATSASKGIIIVSSGIDRENYQKTVDEILHQLKLCQDGQITAEELTAAKKAMNSSLLALQDSLGSMEDFSAFQVLSGFPLDPEDYRRAVEAVDIPQVVAVAKQVKLDTIFFLKGVTNE